MTSRKELIGKTKEVVKRITDNKTANKKKVSDRTPSFY